MLARTRDKCAVESFRNGRHARTAAERLARTRVESQIDGLDGLVNNAGVASTAPHEYVPMDKMRREFEVNVFGQIAVTPAFLPLLRRTRGRIVNIGSVGGHLAIPFGGVLNGTKRAFRFMNDALRLELRPFGLPDRAGSDPRSCRRQDPGRRRP